MIDISPTMAPGPRNARILRRYGHFEQSLFDQITTVATIAGKEQRFVRCNPQGRRTRKQVRRKLALQF
jgi:hypothetical protein